MARFRVTVYATREGSVHMNNGERRVYEIEAHNEGLARHEAIHRAYAEGGLEHVNPVRVEKLG